MRVIAGQLGGRTLKSPAGNKTRPTADRVREALFSVLGNVDDFKVLDLYAGTGALGIEALSRGAARAILVENASDAIRCIRENMSSLQLMNRCMLIPRPVERAREELMKLAPYDLVFCDPPWRILEGAWRWLEALDWLEWLTPGGQLVLEHPSQSTAVMKAPCLDVVQTRAWGDSAVTILRRCSTLEQA
jgi:16S rRNA (guanine966-N2)-methyltransferase